MLERLSEWSEQVDVPLSDEQVEAMRRYWRLVLETNRHTNLTRITEDTAATLKHFVDSLTVLRTGVVLSQARLIDIGTGAGFPGIPLKIARPGLQLTLVDATLKRVRFLQQVIEKFGWNDAKALHERAEQLAAEPNFQGAFDVVVARAVAKLPKLVSLCVPFARKGGHFVAMKGPDVDEEIEEAAASLAQMQARVVDVYRIKLPLDAGRRSLIVIRREG